MLNVNKKKIKSVANNTKKLQNVNICLTNVIYNPYNLIKEGYNGKYINKRKWNTEK